jgi:acyl-CoA dehydrogenase
VTPLVEVVLARWAEARGGLPAADGVSGLAARVEGAVAKGRFTGRLAGAALPLGAAAVIAEWDGQLIRLPTAGAGVAPTASLAGEPRTVLTFDGAVIEWGGEAPCLFLWGALARAAQIAGALDAALAVSIEHANSRTQFGRPISKFQAVQQSLAVFAEEAAAVNCAMQAAAQAADRREARFEIAAAKLRANQAAAVGVAVAHQVHGAIGFTKEHDLHRFTLRLNAWRTEYGNDRLWAGFLGRRVAELGAEGLWPELTRRSDPIEGPS